MAKRLLKRSETSGRIDDDEETVQKRLVTFHQETTPILGYYGKQGKLVTIDANRKPDEVFADVSQVLKRLMDQHVGKQLEFIFIFCIYVQRIFLRAFVCFFRLILIRILQIKVFSPLITPLYT
jgi:hypothetical protein